MSTDSHMDFEPEWVSFNKFCLLSLITIHYHCQKNVAYLLLHIKIKTPTITNHTVGCQNG